MNFYDFSIKSVQNKEVYTMRVHGITLYLWLYPIGYISRPIHSLLNEDLNFITGLISNIFIKIREHGTLEIQRY